MYPDEVGWLVGGTMGILSALAVLDLILWCCSVILERPDGSNRTSRMEAWPIGVRPRIHEALIAPRAYEIGA